MPKEGRHNNTNTHRRTPYPPVTTTMPNQTYSPTALGTDRHASQSWPPDNDDLLMRARQQGMNWQPIATKYFPDKTANACRKRHERLMEKRNNTENWEGVKMETLAKAYNDLREQMWKILGDRVGEKWQTVEAKCMEKGLKTLTTTGRTALRRDRDRLQSSFPSSDIDDDLPHHHSPPSHRSRSHHSDSFNDSGLGNEGDHQFTRDEGPYSAISTTSTTLPTFPSPHHRTQSIASSTIASSTGYTPTMTTAPYPPSSLQQSPPLQQQHNLPPSFSQQQQQTLPSFSTAFGMQSISSVMNPSHHQRGAAVTSHC